MDGYNGEWGGMESYNRVTDTKVIHLVYNTKEPLVVGSVYLD